MKLIGMAGGDYWDGREEVMHTSMAGGRRTSSGDRGWRMSFGEESGEGDR